MVSCMLCEFLLSLKNRILVFLEIFFFFLRITAFFEIFKGKEILQLSKKMLRAVSLEGPGAWRPHREAAQCHLH